MLFVMLFSMVCVCVCVCFLTLLHACKQTKKKPASLYHADQPLSSNSSIEYLSMLQH